MTTDRDLLRIEDLRISFKLLDAQLEVVKGVNFRIRPGEIVALVGEWSVSPTRFEPIVFIRSNCPAA